MNDKLTLDRQTFKVLAADTRVEILKRLAEHKLTLTDLAEQMNMSPSTIKEHLDRLVEVDLIEQLDRGMKWKYYKLTSKGRNIVSPQETKVWILLGTSLLFLAGSAFSLVGKLGAHTKSAVPQLYAAAPPAARGVGMAESMAEDVVNESVKVLAAAPPSTVVEKALEYAPTQVETGLTSMPLPYLEVGVIVLCLIVFGYCMGHIMKKRIRLK